MDYIGATPQANPLLGLLAERLKQAQEFAAKPFGYSNPPAEMIMNLLGVPAVQQTAERLAYGEPLTTGRGMTTQIRPEAVEAALTVAPVAGLLGKGAETAAMAAGRAGERYAEKVVPQIMERGGLPAQLLGDLSQGSIRPMDVWHGSPHGPFTKFDPTKIGSGEGAQAFSYGHYLGEARGTGETYRDNLSDFDWYFDGKNYDANNPAHRAAIELKQLGGDISKEETIKRYEKNIADLELRNADWAKDLSKSKKEELEILKTGVLPKLEEKSKGYLYKVDLPDEAIAKMLDWDKPLSQQHPDVKKALMEHPDVLDFIKNAESQRNRLNEITPMRLQKIPSASIPYDENKMMGKDVLTAIYQRSSLGKTGEAEEQLRQLGIPGVKYLDEGSRAAGKGTQNFVVFPGGEDLLTIKEINDKPVGGLLGQSKAASVAPINSAESNARKAIENLMNQARYFGVDSPIDYANMPVGAVMQDLDSYLGMSKQVADLPDAAKTSLRNLWYKAEDAANAYKRVYGENKLMGKPEAAANDARKNPMLWDEKKLKKLLKDGTFTQDEYENALAWNRKHQGLLD